ncbi:MAG: glycolate oxidase subunit GlcF [Halioglobus sp.]
MHVELHPKYQQTREGEQAAKLISACVHCGFCLATCPTYIDSRDERDSPRGRIYLIKNLLESGEATAQTHTHLDRCLSCRSCETTCPSGMQYGALADLGRELMEEAAPRPPVSRGFRWLLRNVLTRPQVFGTLLRTGQWLRPIMPSNLKKKIPLAVMRRPVPTEQHGRKMLVLEGCVQSVSTPTTNDAARRVLSALGIDLVSTPEAGCCGAVNHHLAARNDGLDNMRRNIDAWWPLFESGAEAIVASASGCGSMVAQYGELLADDPDYADKARTVSERLRDLGQILSGEDLNSLALTPGPQRIAVHTPCTLSHGLGQPNLIQELLQRLEFNTVVTRDDHLCCGSAGTYALLQPKISARLKQAKLSALNIDQPDIIVTANVGCQLHLGEDAQIPVRHWIELIDEALVVNG